VDLLLKRFLNNQPFGSKAPSIQTPRTTPINNPTYRPTSSRAIPSPSIFGLWQMLGMQGDPCSDFSCGQDSDINSELELYKPPPPGTRRDKHGRLRDIKTGDILTEAEAYDLSSASASEGKGKGGKDAIPEAPPPQKKEVLDLEGKSPKEIEEYLKDNGYKLDEEKTKKYKYMGDSKAQVYTKIDKNGNPVEVTVNYGGGLHGNKNERGKLTEKDRAVYYKEVSQAPVIKKDGSIAIQKDGSAKYENNTDKVIIDKTRYKVDNPSQDQTVTVIDAKDGDIIKPKGERYEEQSERYLIDNNTISREPQNSHYDETLHKEAITKRDNALNNFKNSDERQRHVMTLSGYSKSKNQIAVASKAGGSDPSNCVEDIIAKELGYPSDLVFTKPVRPRGRSTKKRCSRCVERYGEEI